MTNGPVPTIAVFSNVPVSLAETFFQMCSGRIGTPLSSITGSGALMWKTTVFGSVPSSTLLMFWTELEYWAFAVSSLSVRLYV